LVQLIHHNRTAGGNRALGAISAEEGAISDRAGSGSFLKKRTKKLSSVGLHLSGQAGPNE
jgi:hypothetical protein